MPALCAEFRKLYPKINFEISLADGFVNILDQDFDLAIRISSAPSDKFTIWRKVCVIPRVLVAAPGSRFAAMGHPGELTPDDLREEFIHSLQKHVEVDEPEPDPASLTAEDATATSADEDEDQPETIAFDRMSEEELLAGIEGLVPPEKSDDY